MRFHTNGLAQRLVLPQRQKFTFHPWAGSNSLWLRYWAENKWQAIKFWVRIDTSNGRKNFKPHLQNRIWLKTLKVTSSHVMYDCGAWFLRVTMSSLRTLCYLPSGKKQKHYFHFFPVQGSVFVISRIIKVSRGKDYRVITPTSIITNTSSSNCLSDYVLWPPTWFLSHHWQFAEIR